MIIDLPSTLANVAAAAFGDDMDHAEDDERDEMDNRKNLNKLNGKVKIKGRTSPKSSPNLSDVTSRLALSTPKAAIGMSPLQYGNLKQHQLQLPQSSHQKLPTALLLNQSNGNAPSSGNSSVSGNSSSGHTSPTTIDDSASSALALAALSSIAAASASSVNGISLLSNHYSHMKTTTANTTDTNSNVKMTDSTPNSFSVAIAAAASASTASHASSPLPVPVSSQSISSSTPVTPTTTSPNHEINNVNSNTHNNSSNSSSTLASVLPHAHPTVPTSSSSSSSLSAPSSSLSLTSPRFFRSSLLESSLSLEKKLYTPPSHHHSILSTSPAIRPINNTNINNITKQNNVNNHHPHAHAHPPHHPSSQASPSSHNNHVECAVNPSTGCCSSCTGTFILYYTLGQVPLIQKTVHDILGHANYNNSDKLLAIEQLFQNALHKLKNDELQLKL